MAIQIASDGRAAAGHSGAEAASDSRSTLASVAEGHRRLAAFTLIEVLAVVAIIGIVAAMALPALLGARASADRLRCLNHLKQIGLALNHYESTHRRYPAVWSITRYLPDGRYYSGHALSPLARMLNELEQPAMYHAINLGLTPTIGDGLVANHTVMVVHLAVAVCPSDEPAPVPGYGRANYRFSIGPIPWVSPNRGNSEAWTGPFTAHRSYAPADFADGLSATVGVSERLQGGWTRGVVKPGGDYLLARVGYLQVGNGIDWSLQGCRSAPPGTPYEPRGGESWFVSGLHFTTYNHVTAPNARDPDCALNGWRGLSFHNRTLFSGVFAARSRHPGGVNVLFMDGGARAVRDGIALAVWRALATRSGGEAIPGDLP